MQVTPSYGIYLIATFRMKTKENNSHVTMQLQELASSLFCGLKIGPF